MAGRFYVNVLSEPSPSSQIHSPPPHLHQVLLQGLSSASSLLPAPRPAAGPASSSLETDSHNLLTGPLQLLCRNWVKWLCETPQIWGALWP